jgi:cellulose synthase operon protein B
MSMVRKGRLAQERENVRAVAGHGLGAWARLGLSGITLVAVVFFAAGWSVPVSASAASAVPAADAATGQSRAVGASISFDASAPPAANAVANPAASAASAGLVAPAGMGDAQPLNPAASQQATFAIPASLTRPDRNHVPTTQDDSDLTPDGRRATLSFRDLGALNPLQLRGVTGENGVPFAVRADEVVTGATLHLIYSYSPALLPDLSHLKVIVNGETAATLPLPSTQAGMLLQRDVPIEPRLLTEFNHVNVELIGHYSKQCEDPANSALWATVSNESALQLTFATLPTRADLSLLPLPFFDRRDVRRLELPIVLPDQPDAGVLEAAGIVSSYFGALAGYRGALFPALVDRLPPTGNAIVFATANAGPRGVVMPPITGPTLAVVDRPAGARGKLLFVLGRDEAELKTAATVLGIGQPSLSGPSAVVAETGEKRPREPYDAPNWVPSDRLVRFGELVPERDLSVSGYGADAVRVPVRIAPDLFGWHSPGVPLDLHYRYTPRPRADKSSLNVSVNDAFVQAIRIPAQSAVVSGLSRWFSRFLPDPSTTARRTVFVPAHLLASQAQLRFHFYYEIAKTGDCAGTFVDNVQGAIDPASTIDLSSYPHYMALPDLAAFSTSGFPFTRLADLSESAVVLPEHPTLTDYSMYFALMGRMGESTGYPVSGVTLAAAADVERVADKDLIVLGAPDNQPLYRSWAKSMPYSYANGVSTYPVSDIALKLVDWWRGASSRVARPLPRGELSVTNDSSGAFMMGFESPLRAGRSVVALVASDADRAGDIERALMDPDLVSQIQGGFDTVRGVTITPISNGNTYYVGRLPPAQYLRWILYEHPWLLVIFGALAALLIAVLMYRGLRRIAARRLEEGQ